MIVIQVTDLLWEIDNILYEFSKAKATKEVW